MAQGRVPRLPREGDRQRIVVNLPADTACASLRQGCPPSCALLVCRQVARASGSAPASPRGATDRPRQSLCLGCCVRHNYMPYCGMKVEMGEPEER